MKNAKVILITGASSGIGYGAAETLAKQGHHVYAAARRVERMEPLKEFGVNILKMDVTDEDSMKQGVEAVFQAEGRIDVLVNNAGYGYFGAIENVSLEEARRQVEVNVFGLARLTQLVLPIMRAQGSGRIINTSSIAGKMVIYLGGWYNVTKYAVEAFSDALRMEVKPFGIDVANTMTWYYHSKMLSSPDVVTRAISRAVNRRHPRVRYRVGLYSFSGVFFHQIMPARWWDAMMRKLGKVKVKGS